MTSQESSFSPSPGRRARSGVARREDDAKRVAAGRKVTRRGQHLVPGAAHFGVAEPGSEKQLDSWKEIAAHLGGSVRSASRWEKEEGLPVHRHSHGKGDSVYAYRAELDDWSNKRRSKLSDRDEVIARVSGKRRRGARSAVFE